MSRKGENIYKRRDGRWEARYPKGYDPSGRVRYGSCYGKTYTEAKSKAERARVVLLAGATPNRVTSDTRPLKFFCDEWLENVREDIKPSTYARYSSVLAKYIIPQMGTCFPLAISSQTVSGFKHKLLSECRLAPKTVKDILVILRSILKYTAKQYPSGFPPIEITYPKEYRKEMRVLNQEEQQRLTNYLAQDMDPCKFGVLLALLTGLRIGELCALRWGNISLPNRALRVNATIQRLPSQDGVSKTKLVLGNPKSVASARTIPLSDFAVQLCKQIGPYRPLDYVLTGTEHCMEPRTLQYRIKKYADACGMEGIHFHTLRHTFATRCVEVGFEIKSLSEILGHANTAITLERYVHSSMDLKRKNIKKLTAVGL